MTEAGTQPDLKTAIMANIAITIRHFRKDEKFGGIFLGRPRRINPPEYYAIENNLYASSLDKLGIPKDGGPEMVEACKIIADTFLEMYPKWFPKWVEEYKEPLPHSTDHRDRRVRMIVEIAKSEMRKVPQ